MVFSLKNSIQQPENFPTDLKKLYPPHNTNKKVKNIILAILAILSAIGAIASIIATGITGIIPLILLAIPSLGIMVLCLKYLLKKPEKIVSPPRLIQESPQKPMKTGPQRIHISPPPSKAMLDFMNYRQRLSSIFWVKKDNIDEISVRCIPTPGTISNNIWELSGSKLTLIDTQGDITKPRYKTSLYTLFINAANPQMIHGGGGTNAAFTKAVSRACWQNSKKSIDPNRSDKPLEIGECRSCIWENSDGTSNLKYPGEPHYFGQLLGPRACDLKNDYQQAYRDCKKAYTNCLLEAKRLGVNLVQLPLISSGIYAPPNTQEEGKTLQLWIDAIKSALVEAVQDFGLQEDNRGRPWIIVLTGLNGTQLD
ncbi:macro domain-containing protein [Chlamydia sp. 17-3921]|uniref:macro domain-containing protein n=1 Tax=Chlamydia sp. 17-3921 TaxID=2675798 RepID=UPI00191926CD|nr:macro domain-containing protein [Chlamydia sp. 17-3921]